MINKVVFFVVFFVVSYLTLHAQEFQATAVYTVKINTSDIAAKIQSQQDIPLNMQLIVDAKMKAISEKTYSLNFNKTTSTYKEIPSRKMPSILKCWFQSWAATRSTRIPMISPMR